jgi:hypothetical protein
MIVMPVRTVGKFVREEPRRLFSVRAFYFTQGRNFDITPDGQRFLMLKELPRPASARTSPTSINVVLNWTEELKQRVAK